MAPITIPLLKFVGTISVGLLTVSSATPARHPIPSPISPSAHPNTRVTGRILLLSNPDPPRSPLSPLGQHRLRRTQPPRLPHYPTHDCPLRPRHRRLRARLRPRAPARRKTPLPPVDWARCGHRICGGFRKGRHGDQVAGARRRRGRGGEWGGGQAEHGELAIGWGGEECYQRDGICHGGCGVDG